MRVWLQCRGLLVLGLALGLVLGGLAQAAAQQFPAKPMTLVVPAAPGGVTDLIARALGQQFTESFGQPVVVEDKPGATNQIAAEYVAHSAADGYTLLVSPEATFVINPYLFQKLSYDPAKDFVPVSGLISIEQALIGSPELQVSNVADLIALAKREPGALNYGTFGVGSTGHLNMEMLESKAGVRFVPIHYKGATPALADVLAGHIQMMFISVGSAVEPWRAGKIKMLAIGGKQRLARLPEIPTIAESGMPGFEAVSWFGLFAPAGTPPAIVDILNKQTQRTLSDQKFRATVLEPQFFEAMAGSPQDFAAFIKTDAEKWSGVIRAANVKVE
jgi:tripartite-type tricarboxylate transporter receptor subunit TctC